ncbi:hypothetical protein BDV12DRAFT_202663 [Aspergillus spectabilis]
MYFSDLMRRHARQSHNSETRRLCDIRGERASQTYMACRLARPVGNVRDGKDPYERHGYNGGDCLAGGEFDQQLACVPSSTQASKVQHYTRRYFQHFHSQWPLLHPGTYNVETEPPLLVYSVVVMGLSFEGTASSRAAALALHAKLGEDILQQQSRWDGTSLPSSQDSAPGSMCPVATYQAIILHLIFAVQRAAEVPLSQTHYNILLALVQGHRVCGVYWVGIEEIKRVGIALNRVCELYRIRFPDDVGRSGTLTWADLHFPVPDSEELWNATSNELLARRLAELKADSALDGRCEENWISNLCSRETLLS